MTNYFKMIIRKISKLPAKLFLINLRTKNNIELGRAVRMDKIPLLKMHKEASLLIGNNVVINSNNNNYHVNMFNRCKLMIDKKGGQIRIGNNTRIHGSCIHAYLNISIGENCLIAANCQIIDNNGHDTSFPDVSNRILTKGTTKEVIIEDNVWLATGVVVLPGVRIGNGSIISANSVVNRDIPQMVIAGGNPIKIIKRKY